MKNFKHYLLLAVAVLVGISTIIGFAGIVPDGGLLADLVNIFSIGGLGGIIIAPTAIVSTSESEPEGTTVVSTKADDGTGGETEQEYLEEDLNKSLVLIRPQDTPIDTLTRTIKNIEESKSWEAGGWELGIRDIVDRVGSPYSNGDVLNVANGDLWLPGDTFTFFNDTGLVLDSQSKPISCIITAVNGNNLTVKRIGAVTNMVIPAITGGTYMLRQSRAVSELEASVTGFAIAPSNRKYYNQIHMTQVEESVIHSLLKKKVAMDFSVYKEQTLWDFKRGMELCNLFQDGGLGKNAKGEIIHLSTGLWHQMDRQSAVDYNNPMTDRIWNMLCKDIFDGNNGSDRKFLLAGPDLLDQAANVGSYSKQLEAKNTELVCGLRVNRIETPHGELLIKPLGSLMPLWFSKCGMVIDINFLKKFVMEPLQTTNLDLNRTGQRRVDNAVRMHETYSLFLENLPVHRRIVPQA